MSRHIAAPHPVVEEASGTEPSDVHADILTPYFPPHELMTLDRLTDEVEHPDHHDAHPQHGDPEARLRFYARQGARLLPLPYFTPVVGDGEPRTSGMMLAVLHAHPTLLGDDDNEIDSEPIAAVLHLQAGDIETHDDARTQLIAAAAARPTLPLLRADRPGDVPIGIPD